MSATTPDTADVVASVSKLTISPTTGTKPLAKASKPKPKPQPKSKPKKEKVADSWEDEELSSEAESETGAEAGANRDSGSEDDADRGGRPSASGSRNTAGTEAPPPTPISPTYGLGSSAAYPPGFAAASGPTAEEITKRPEKTDAVARRMIASAIGIKLPKQTEEQKAYDRAMRESVRKRKEEEREAERKRQVQAEENRRAIWED